jgi:hypothetical protein
MYPAPPVTSTVLLGPGADDPFAGPEPEPDDPFAAPFTTIAWEFFDRVSGRVDLLRGRGDARRDEMGGEGGTGRKFE